jgi:Chemotaxis protein histidine kinase and related kinases
MLIDRDLFEHLREPIYHILRNSIIHGIESSNQRKQKKKNEPISKKIHTLISLDLKRIY